MIAKHLLDIIVCPVDHQPLRLAEDSLIERLNRAIQQGVINDRASRLVTSTLEEGLIREDGRIIYPIRDGIPVLLAEEGIDLTEQQIEP
ncbi:MAG: Trm112 family protein [Thermoguttaceae bacterium]